MPAGVNGFIRRLTCTLFLVFALAPWVVARAEAPLLPRFIPCSTQTPSIMVIGHLFGAGDKCVPVTITVTWRNSYDLQDGYGYYNLKYTHKFSGELRYRSDHEEFTLVGDPAHWEGFDKIREFNGGGQYCARFDDKGGCEDLRKFVHVGALRTGGVYLGSVTYGYPEVVTNGERVPVTFFAQSPLFEFWNDKYTWRPDGGVVEINNPALIHFDYKALTRAAANDDVYTVTVPYQHDNDTEDTPTHNSGELKIKLDFDKACNGENETGMSKCEQIKGLLSELKWAIQVRDAYRDMLPLASNMERLEQHVLAMIHINNRYMTEEEAAELERTFGQTNSSSLEITVPDLCNKCTARPLCEWRTQAIRVHEETNLAYLKLNPQDKALLNIDRGQVSDQNAVDLEQARILSQIEYRSYNERAKFLLKLIEEQIREATDCPFSVEFEEQVNSWAGQIDMDVTLQAPPRPPGGHHP